MSIRIKQWKEDKEEFEVIQWNYDKSQGRSIPKKIGNFRISWMHLPTQILEMLTEDEKADLNIFWKTTREGREIERLKSLTILANKFSRDIKTGIEKDVFEIADLEKLASELQDAKNAISKKIARLKTQAKKAEKNG